jgi:cupin fold WbuC family metalloprotein
MYILSDQKLQDLSLKAKKNVRLRKSLNIHESHEESCQRLLNSILVGSYIHPHRHCLDSKKELLVAIKGKFAIIEFTNAGKFNQSTIFSSQKYADSCDTSYGVEVTPNCWHTVIALEEDSCLLEVKEGPYDSSISKELASWAPKEGDIGNVNKYVKSLYKFCEYDLI